MAAILFMNGTVFSQAMFIDETERKEELEEVLEKESETEEYISETESEEKLKTEEETQEEIPVNEEKERLNEKKSVAASAGEGADVDEDIGLQPTALEEAEYGEAVYRVGDFKALKETLTGIAAVKEGKSLIIIEKDIKFDSAITLDGLLNQEIAIKGENGTKKLIAPDAGAHIVLEASVNDKGEANGLKFSDIVFDRSSGAGGIRINDMAEGDLIIDGNGTTVFDGEGGTIDDSENANIRLGNATSEISIVIRNLSMNRINRQNGGNIGVYAANSRFDIAVENCEFSNFKANNYGGAAILFTGKKLKVTSCLFQNIETVNKGAAISFTGIELSISKSKMTNNVVSNNPGGAIYITSANRVDIEESIFKGNYSSGEGGAIAFNSGANNTITKVSNTSFVENSTNDKGGALALNGGEVIFQDIGTGTNIFSNNKSENNGGAIYAGFSTKIYVKRGTTTFIRNESKNANGGAIYADGQTIIANTTFTENQAPKGNGGAVYINGQPLSVDTSLFSENKAENGAGIYSTASALRTNTLSIDKTEFHNNTADAYGGGIYFSTARAAGTPVILNDVQLGGDSPEKGNQAQKGGGLYYNFGTTASTLELKGTTSISHNTAELAGGGIYAAGSTLAVLAKGQAVSDNRALNGAGLYFENNSTSINAYVDSLQFQRNHAEECGGGVYLSSNEHKSEIIFQGSSSVASFEENTAGQSGGGIFSDGRAVVRFENLSFKENAAVTNGGAMGFSSESYMDENVHLDRVRFQNNKADSYISFITDSDRALHDKFIKNTTTFSSNPYGVEFDHGFNNYDLSHTGDTVKITYYENTETKAPHGILNVDYAEKGAAALLTSYSEEQLPVWPDYTFLGWNQSAEGSAPRYVNGTSETLAASSQKDMDLFGIWQQDSDIAVEKIVNGGESLVFSGAKLEYKVTVTNKNSTHPVARSDWTGTVIDILPEQYQNKDAVKNVQVSGSQSSYGAWQIVEEDGRIQLQIPDVVIAGSGSLVITYELEAPSLEKNQVYTDIVNKIIADGKGGKHSSDDTNKICVVPIAGELKMSKSLESPVIEQGKDDQIAVSVGDILVYKIQAENVGAADSILYDVVLKDELPEGLRFYGDVKLDGVPVKEGYGKGEYDFINGILTYRHDSWLSGKNAVAITFKAQVSGAAGGKIGNVAQGSASIPINPVLPGTEPRENDLKEGENIYDEDKSASAVPDIELRKSSREPIVIGGSIEYTITLSNAEAGGVWKGKIEDLISRDVRFLEISDVTFTNTKTGELAEDSSYDSENSGYDSGQRKLVLEDIRLYGGQTMTICYSVQLLNQTTEVSNTAYAVSEDHKTESVGETRSVSYNPGIISIEKTVTGTDGPDYVDMKNAELAVGDTVRYVLKVRNSSEDPRSGLQNIWIEDQAPDDISFIPGSIRVYDGEGVDIDYENGSIKKNKINLHLDKILCGGQTVYVSIEAQVTGKSRPRITNTAIAKADTPEKSYHENGYDPLALRTIEAQAVQENRNADYESIVKIEIEASPVAYSGEMIDYQFKIQNTSTDTVFRGEMYMILPEGLALDPKTSGEIKITGSGNVSYGKVEWDDGYTHLKITDLHIPPGESVESTGLQVQVPVFMDIGTVKYTTEAAVYAKDGNEEDYDTTIMETVVTAGPGELKFAKYATSADMTYDAFIQNPEALSQEEIEGTAGTRIKYWLVAENVGRKDSILYQIVLRDELLGGLIYQEGSERINGSSDYSGAYVWDENTSILSYKHDLPLRGGERLVLSFEAAFQAGEGMIANTAWGTAEIPDIENPVAPGGSNNPEYPYNPGDLKAIGQEDSWNVYIMASPEETLGDKEDPAESEETDEQDESRETDETEETKSLLEQTEKAGRGKQELQERSDLTAAPGTGDTRWQAAIIYLALSGSMLLLAAIVIRKQRNRK